MENSITVRPAHEGDIAFIYATFLRGLYYGNPFYGAINKTDFFDNYPKVLDRLLKKNNVIVKIACLSQDENVILGYAILENNILHYVAVKEAWRRQGIAKQLLRGSEITHVTHVTKLGSIIAKRKGWITNPFLI